MANMMRDLRRQMLLRRNVVASLAFLGFFCAYTMRVNLSVAVVSMTSKYSAGAASENGTAHSESAHFDWDTVQKGYLLGSFFYGYVTTQLAGGWLGIKYGGVAVFGVSVCACAILNLTLPLAANFGFYPLLVVRILTGVAQGVTFPCIHAVWANWAPPQERTRLASFAYSGGFFGTVVAFPACAILADAFGWPSTFYVPAVLSLLWCLAWFTWIKDEPKDDRWITPEELKFLEESAGDGGGPRQEIRHPWLKYFTSMPVWAIVCAHFCENWGFYTMLTQLPSFMNDTLDYDVKSAGLLSALPYLVMSVGLLVVGFFVDKLREKRIFTTTGVRKIFNCGAFVGQTIFVVAAARVQTPSLCIFFITLTIGLGAFAWAAFSVNPLDLAPKQAGVIMGISNTFATVAGILCPSVAGLIVRNKSRDEWRIVMYVCGAIYAFGAVFYAAFASGELQPWAAKADDEQVGQRRRQQRQQQQQQQHQPAAATEDAAGDVVPTRDQPS